MEFNKAVIFTIGNEEYGIDISQVERILGYTNITSVPEVPSYVLGVIQYNNTILPIIDLATRFNKERVIDVLHKKIIVIKSETMLLGALVDDVREVRDIDINNIEQTPDIVKSYANRYIKGVYKEG